MSTSKQTKVITAVVSVAAVAWFINLAVTRTRENALELTQWPAEIAATKQYCTLDTYQNCKPDDWFGIYKSQTASLETNLAATVCLEPRKFDNANFFRQVTDKKDYLFLCKMNPPDAIRREDVVAAIERIAADRQEATALPDQVKTAACAVLIRESGYENDLEHAGMQGAVYAQANPAAASQSDDTGTETLKMWKSKVESDFAGEKLSVKSLATIAYDRFCR
jgi:hypothetical protein